MVWLAGLVTLWISPVAAARDLTAVADGEHLWLVMADPDASEVDGPGRRVYHATAGGAPGVLSALEPMTGRLMKRGAAAGDGRLLMVTRDRRVQTVRPVWSDLLERYLYDTRTLPALPEGCALLSAALSARGPWVLVRVEDASLFEPLDLAPRSDEASLRRTQLNRALGLPDDFVLDRSGGGGAGAGEGGAANDNGARQSGRAAGEAGEPALEENKVGGGQGPTEQVADPTEGPSPETSTGAARGAAPALRLLTLHGGGWVSSPLPEGLPEPRHAELVMEDDDPRPTLIVETIHDVPNLTALIRYSPIAPAGEDAAPGWAEQTIVPRPWPGRVWSAAMVRGQAAVAIERQRSAAWLDVGGYLLRGNEAIRFADFQLNVPGGQRWAAVPWRGALAVVVSPGPRLSDEQRQANPKPPLAAIRTIGLNGQPYQPLPPGHENAAGIGSTLVLLREPATPPAQGNLDLYIQIGAFTFAMLMMLLFYRQAPRAEQIDLPDHLVLASLTRRIIAGVIDLTPGFLLASAVYGTTFSETLLYWPGNGVPKVLSAMKPGIFVIVVTVAHTTVFEYVTARSIGKWLTGLYVADLTGKPAAPWPCTSRALTRVFDLFAPLILIIVVISPARQRLGDILAETTVVMRKPEPLDLGDEE